MVPAVVNRNSVGTRRADPAYTKSRPAGGSWQGGKVAYACSQTGSQCLSGGPDCRSHPTASPWSGAIKRGAIKRTPPFPAEECWRAARFLIGNDQQPKMQAAAVTLPRCRDRAPAASLGPHRTGWIAPCQAASSPTRTEPLAGPAAVVTERRCAKCGGPLASLRDDVRYCSSPCRKAAYRQHQHPTAASMPT